MIDRSKKILLGSGSPRRKLLIEELGYRYRILNSNIDETPLQDLKGIEIAEYLSTEKARALMEHINKDEILLTADTIVWLDSEMLGKPNNAVEAFNILKKLSGRMHQVFTGICLIYDKQKITFSIQSDVVFHRLSEEEIMAYINSFHPYDKAGSYGAQECLTENYNPCSEKEQAFLAMNKLDDLLYKTLSGATRNNKPFIDQISGSYFNVMGLPIVELVEKINSINKT